MSMIISSPILDEIRRLHDDGASGILTLAGNSERVELFFREGMVEAGSSNLNSRRIGDYFVKEGYATPRDLEAVDSLAKNQKVLFGEGAARKGLLSQAEVAAIARQQSIEFIDHAVRNGFAVDSFKGNLRSYFAPARISFAQVLLEICRRTAKPVECPVHSLIALRGGINLSTFQWYPQELYVLSELQYPNTFEQLLKTTALQQSSLSKILGVLDALGVLEFQDASQTTEEVLPDTLLVRSLEFSFEHLIPVVTDALLSEKIEVARNEMSFTSEQFKNLKVQIGEANCAAPIKVLTVSSPDPKDGKSLMSTNLAFSFAMDPGRRVIIIDCDLRKPSLGSYLGVTAEPGLLQYLANGHLSPYCYVRRLRNLYFLTSGGIAPNPVEILSMQKMKQLVEHLKKDFDTIILDAPPYGPIADARIVTGLSDGLIMVVRRGKTSYSSSDRAFKAIDRNKLLGVVFNDVQAQAFNTYHELGYYRYGSTQSKKVYAPAVKARNTPQNYLES